MLPPTAYTRGVFTREEAIEAGWTDRTIRTQLANRVLTSLARGAYVESIPFDAAEPLEKFRLSSVAVGLRRDVVLTGPSAAAALGYDLLYSSLRRITMRRRNRLADDDIMTASDVLVTRPALTIVTCAQRLGTEPALVIADSALRVEATDCGELREQVARLNRQPGTRSAAIVAAEANGLAQTPLETISRWRFLVRGLPRPRLQMPIVINPWLTYYTDFGWEELMTVGEADGITKYDREGQVIKAEKVRELQIEDTGREIARWIWDEMWWAPNDVAARVQRKFDLGRRRVIALR